jgi:hypothetical protein
LPATLKANRIDPADVVRTASGAELHYMTGGEVVRVAMVLKENRLIRLKVNQVTSRYRPANSRTSWESWQTSSEVENP